MELIEVSTVKVLSIQYQIYEAAIDATISDTYWCESSEMETEETRLDDWIKVEEHIRSHINSIDSKYDPDFLEADLNTRLQTSKCSEFISSSTVEN